MEKNNGNDQKKQTTERQEENGEKKRKKSTLDFYHEQCEDLVNVTAKLRHKKIQEGKQYNGRFNRVLDEIESFFQEELNDLQTKVDDYSQKKGRCVEIQCENSVSSVPDNPDIFNKTVNTIMEKQYHRLSNKARILKIKAKGFLEYDDPDTLFEEYTSQRIKKLIEKNKQR